MIEHDRALELASAALDFPLSDEDRHALQAHLDGCAECRAVDAQLRADAGAIAALATQDAPDALRARVLAAAAAPAPVEPPAASPGPAQARVLTVVPPRFRRPVAVLAAAAVVVALIGGTLYWRSNPNGGPDVAVSSPSPSFSPSASGPPTPSGEPDGHDPSGAWSEVADLTADDVQDGVLALTSGFRLVSLDGTPAADLARRLSTEPPVRFSVAADADGRSARLTPSEPLTAGAVYRFRLTGADGRTLDSWAFQTHQPLQVVSTVPEDTATDVPTNTGIEVTFDQDGVVDAANHLTIAPKVAGRFEQHGRTLVFVPAKRLAKATIYTVTVSRGVAVGATGDALANDVRFRFETAATTKRPTRFDFTNDVFDVATSERPTLAVWVDQPYEGDQAPTPPKSVKVVVDRLPDVGAAIAAYRQVRAYPTWAWASAPGLVPTKGLTRVASFDAALKRDENSGFIWFQLPKRLPAGWYIVTLPSVAQPVQTIVQVSDIAGYLVVSTTKTLVWANDLATGKPVAGASVTTDGADLGRTGSDGTRVIDTPAGLTGQDGSCAGECLPIVTVQSGGQATFLPADAGATGAMGYSGDYGRQPTGTTYWSTFDTDRTLYRRTDTVNAWGVVRDRQTGKVPATVTLRVFTASPYDYSGSARATTGAPLSVTDAQPNAIGAYAASIALDDVPAGSYTIESSVGAEVVGSRSFGVDRILKPAYRIDVATGRRVYFLGDQVRITATASFFEGSPVAGVPLRLEGIVEKKFTTDANGTATTRATIKLEDESAYGPEVQTINVSPARAEEGQINGQSHEIIAFPSTWTVTATTSVDGGRVKVAGSLHAVDRDRLEREIAAGNDIWSLDPAGAPLADRTVKATFTELIPYRIKVGSHYDFIEKKVVDEYETGTTERGAGTIAVKSNADGTLSASIATSTGHTYKVSLAATDPDGHVTRWLGWASPTGAQEDQDTSTPFLHPTTDPEVVREYGVGDAIDLTLSVPASPGDKPGAYLFYTAEVGLRDVVVQDSSRFRSTFTDAAPPGIEITGVRFTGSTYVVADPYYAQFRSSDRALTVGLTTDAARYDPGGTVALTVTTRDHAGQPVPATVVLRAVDEKLFAIGGAEAADPLSELYQDVGSGIIVTYRSHREPIYRPEGGDTGGGGDDGAGREAFRDVVLFRQVDTGADGRAVVTFQVSDDLTSWVVSASAFGQGLLAGEGTMNVPVGLPFFVDATIATDYLVTDRPAIGLRAYGTALVTGAPVTFAVDSDSLGLHLKGLASKASETKTVPLPKLTVGQHKITITATSGAGATAHKDVLTRMFLVVPSRMTSTQAHYVELTGSSALQGGPGRVEVLVSDAGPAAYVPLLLGLTDVESGRLERTLAATLAASLVSERFAVTDAVPGITFDGATYQRADGGLSVLPYSGSDLKASALAALVAPDRFDRDRLSAYFSTVLGDAKATRERRNLALSGLAGLHEPVLPRIRTAAADPDLTVRERLMLGLGAAALGDAATARAIGASLETTYGEITTEQARLRAGASAADITEGTALMAMLAAADGDPLAARFWSYVEGNPGSEEPYALHAVGFVNRLLERVAPRAASFAYTLDGLRQVVDLAPGETFQLSVSPAQLGSLTIEPVTGKVGVTTSWDVAAKPATIAKDPDLKVTRRMTPTSIGRASLVVVDVTVDLGPKAPAGCHLVTDLVPSGLVPVGSLQGWVDPATGDAAAPKGVQYPYAQDGQRVTFCAEKTKKSHIAHLRYFARVVTSGTYTWEPTVVESRSMTGRAAMTKASVITIR